MIGYITQSQALWSVMKQLNWGSCLVLFGDATEGQPDIDQSRIDIVSTIDLTTGEPLDDNVLFSETGLVSTIEKSQASMITLAHLPLTNTYPWGLESQPESTVNDVVTIGVRDGQWSSQPQNVEQWNDHGGFVTEWPKGGHEVEQHEVEGVGVHPTDLIKHPRPDGVEVNTWLSILEHILSHDILLVTDKEKSTTWRIMQTVGEDSIHIRAFDSKNTASLETGVYTVPVWISEEPALAVDNSSVISTLEKMSDGLCIAQGINNFTFFIKGQGSFREISQEDIKELQNDFADLKDMCYSEFQPHISKD